MSCLKDTLELFIELLSLGEAIYTTIAFDQEKFGFYYIAMVFMFLPMADSILKLFVYCTVPTWDDMLVNISMEVAQAFLYIYFCSFDEGAQRVLWSIMGVQIFFWVWLWCMRESREWVTREQIGIRGYFCCISNCSNVFVNIFGFLNILMQEESPFRSVQYEVVLAIGAWIANLNLVYMGSELEENIDTMSDFQEIVQFYTAGDRKGIVGLVNVVTYLWIMIISVYNSCLSWIWWYSPEIDATFDKVMSMINIVSSVLFLGGYLCGAMCPNAGRQGTGAPEQPVSCCKVFFALILIGTAIGVPVGVISNRSDFSKASAIARREGFDYAWPASKGRLLAETDSLGNLPHSEYTTKNFEECAIQCADIDSLGGAFFPDIDFDNCICNRIIDCVEPSSSDGDDDVQDDNYSSSKATIFSTVPRPDECVFSFCEYFPGESLCNDPDPFPPACGYDKTFCEWNDLGSPIVGDTSFERAGFSVSLSDDGKTLVIGSPGYTDEYNGGSIRVFTWTGSWWSQRGYDIYGTQAYMFVGTAVKVSGDGLTIAIAAPGADASGPNSNNGKISVWRWNGEEHEAMGDGIEGNKNDNIGLSLALSYDGSILTFGANDNDGIPSLRKGVEVYYWSGSTWRQRGATIPVKNYFNETGLSVSLTPDGNTLAIGDWHFDHDGETNAGYASVYDWNGSASWERRYNGIFGKEGDFFGYSIALSSDGLTLIVGATQAGSGTGSVSTFVDNGNSWELIDTMKGSLLNDMFGRSIALSSDGNTLVVGADGVDRFGTTEAGSHGQTKVFDRNRDLQLPSTLHSSTSLLSSSSNALWRQRGTDINGQHDEDWSGYSVSVSSKGNIVAIGESGYEPFGQNKTGRTIILYWGQA